MKEYKKLIAIAKEEDGYLEKKSDALLYSKTENAGNNNYTKYAKELYPSLQGQPWCDMFVDWCFVQAFGKLKAQQLLGGSFSAYTPTSAGCYKKKGHYDRLNPQPGDQIFFRNSVRICHTGIVTEVTLTKVRTIEGNTSSGVEMIANGGGVCQKEYLLTASSIDGYGHPDWTLVLKPRYEVGWHHDRNGWWYADTEGTYYKSGWQVINRHRYCFNPDGYAVTGWQVLDGKDYYFEPRAGHELECALYISTADGAQAPGMF